MRGSSAAVSGAGDVDQLAAVEVPHALVGQPQVVRLPDVRPPLRVDQLDVQQTREAFVSGERKD